VLRPTADRSAFEADAFMPSPGCPSKDEVAIVSDHTNLGIDAVFAVVIPDQKAAEVQDVQR
jgi:hypothetical protein